MEKEELRLETNKLMINIVRGLLDKGHITVDGIIDNLDEFVRCLMACGVTNGSTATKFSKCFYALNGTYRRSLLFIYEDY